MGMGMGQGVGTGQLGYGDQLRASIDDEMAQVSAGICLVRGH